MTRISLAERMSRLDEMKARLARDEAKLKADLSKQRTRRLVEAGQLVERSGLLDLDDDVLYGALLSLAEARHDPDWVAAWTERGRRAFDEEKERHGQKKEPLTVTFPAPLPTAFATRLRAAGLRFNKLLQHWEGMAEHSAVAALAAERSGAITRVRAKQTEQAEGGTDQNPLPEEPDKQRGRRAMRSDDDRDPREGTETRRAAATEIEVAKK